MSQQSDAIIIGAGVIGTAVAFEMAKNGWKTLSLDRNAQIGQGSTAGSCAIIRMHYSTFDGTAFAWEGYHYWRDWKAYLGLPDGHALAQFKECGCMVMRTEVNGNLDKHLENSRDLDIPVEEWDEAAFLDKLPIYRCTVSRRRAGSMIRNSARPTATGSAARSTGRMAAM